MKSGFFAVVLSLALVCSFNMFAEKKIVLGFAQVGSESDWRIANTESIKKAALDTGIELKFSDAQQNQEAQIKAIKSFIAQKVDVIAFSPVVESGWDDVLMKAKKANIPVVIVDRKIKVADSSLWVTYMGSDFYKEGVKAGKWLVDYIKTTGKSGTINIVELQGTLGSAPAIDRKKGFEDAILVNPNLKITKSEVADFTKIKGKEVMASFLKADKKNIHVLFAHNDNMALGAIQAIEEAGLVPGKDIVIISVDAIKEAFEAIVAGKINVTVECSPLLGPQLMDVVKKLVNKEKVEKNIVTIEGIFDAKNAAKELPNRKY